MTRHLPRSFRSKCLGVALLGLAVAAAHTADTAYYDTAWSFVYDGGLAANNRVIADNFRDVKILPNGEAICVGESRDSTFLQTVLLAKLSPSGKLLERRLYRFNHGTGASAVLLAKNGEILIGGYRSTSPLLLRLNQALEIKSSIWYFDSLSNQLLLSNGATLNSLIETDGGGIVAAAGDIFPDNRGQALNDYAAYLEFDTASVVKRVQEWKNVTGYDIAGWSIAKDGGGRYLMGGNQAAFALDSAGREISKNIYTFSLAGVGTVTNAVSRVKRLRSGTLMVAGQSYEEDCWTRYQRLSFDAWWSTLSGFGMADGRNTAGISGSHDAVYDFTQLIDGRIAFVGRRQNADLGGGVWAFVTDSTGDTILWESQVWVPYKSSPGAAANPYAVAATPDSGFTVVGPYVLSDSLGGSNAFALHFVPKPLPVSVRRSAGDGAHVSRRGANWVFTFQASGGGEAELRIADFRGRMVKTYRLSSESTGRREFAIDASHFGRGVFQWRLDSNGQSAQGRISVLE